MAKRILRPNTSGAAQRAKRTPSQPKRQPQTPVPTGGRKRVDEKTVRRSRIPDPHDVFKRLPISPPNVELPEINLPALPDAETTKRRFKLPSI